MMKNLGHWNFGNLRKTKTQYFDDKTGYSDLQINHSRRVGEGVKWTDCPLQGGLAIINLVKMEERAEQTVQIVNNAGI